MTRIQKPGPRVFTSSATGRPGRPRAVQIYYRSCASLSRTAPSHGPKSFLCPRRRHRDAGGSKGLSESLQL
eukprot:2979269-Rhodomonas_salina.4